MTYPKRIEVRALSPFNYNPRPQDIDYLLKDMERNIQAFCDRFRLDEQNIAETHQEVANGEAPFFGPQSVDIFHEGGVTTVVICKEQAEQAAISTCMEFDSTERTFRMVELQDDEVDGEMSIVLTDTGSLEVNTDFPYTAELRTFNWQIARASSQVLGPR